MAGTTSRRAMALDIDTPDAEASKNNASRKPSVFSNYVRKLLRQELESCLTPIPTLAVSSIFFGFVAVVAISLGAIIYRQTLQNAEVTLRYDDFDLKASNRTAQLTERAEIVELDPAYENRHPVIITEKMESPVYVYYELTDFFQSHKRYIRSISEEQMGGRHPSGSSIAQCDPYRYQKIPDSESPPATRPLIVPCGLVAHSFFNDSFVLDSAEDERGNELNLDWRENGIATEWDRKYLYGDVQPENFNNVTEFRGGGVITGTLKEDEHFMVWMRVGAMPTIRKLYAVIHEDIPEGSVLVFNITHQYNTYQFDGKKRLVLSTSNWTGGRNVVTGVVYFVIGSLSAVACIAILFMDVRSDRRPESPQ